MKILLTTPTYPPFNSGLGNAVEQQASILVKAGHEVTVATGGEVRTSLSEPNGIRVETFAIQGADYILNPIKGNEAAYIDFLKSSNWDVVVLNAWQNWATDLAFKHLQQVSGRKYIYSHCISTNIFFWHQPLRSVIRYLAWRPYWLSLKRRLSLLDGIVFLSESGGGSRFDDLAIAQTCGINTYVIPNALSSQALDILEQPITPLESRSQLIAVGSYQWQKGFDFVLEAYANSSAKNRMPIKIFGQQHSPYTLELRALSKRLGILPEFVEFHEGISGARLLQEYAKSMVFLSGSYTECQPLVLLDANASGTPFIARSTGCIANMPGGYAVNHVSDMACRIDELIGSKFAWNRLSDSGRQAAWKNYHPEIIGNKLLSVFEAKPSAIMAVG